MTLGDYSPRSIQNYLREMRFIGEYYPDVPLEEFTRENIESYVLYLKQTLGSGRDKCRMVAQSLSFVFKNVLQKPYVLPSKLYPKKTFILPEIFSVEEIEQLLKSPLSLKQQALVQLFYSTGVRLEECTKIKICDVDSRNLCIHLHGGKGRKDRKLLLSEKCLFTLREYYKKHRPKEFLFEGIRPGKSIHPRAVQHAVYESLKTAGLAHKGYSPHTFRHSFATHLLDNGTDIHTIKELLGHSKLETTMVYLHLQSKKRLGIVSPLDALYKRNDLERVPIKEAVK